MAKHGKQQRMSTEVSNSDKPPRQWAIEIAALPDLPARRMALEWVPDNCRPIVETHLRLAWMRKKHEKDSMASGQRGGND